MSVERQAGAGRAARPRGTRRRARAASTLAAARGLARRARRDRPSTLAKAGDETTVRFAVTPPARAAAVEVAPGDRGRRQVVERAARTSSTTRTFPMQVVLQPAQRSRSCRCSAKVPDGPIGYVRGSGDTVADDLAHVGLRVEMLDDETLRSGDLVALPRDRRRHPRLQHARRAAQPARAPDALRRGGRHGRRAVQHEEPRSARSKAASARTRSRSGAAASPTRRAAMTVLAPGHELADDAEPDRAPPTSTAGSRSAASTSPRPGTSATRRSSAPPIRARTPLARRPARSPSTGRAATSTPGSRSSGSFPPACPAPTACSPTCSGPRSDRRA